MTSKAKNNINDYINLYGFTKSVKGLEAMLIREPKDFSHSNYTEYVYVTNLKSM